MILVPNYFCRVVNILILAARAALSSPGVPVEIRVAEMKRICVTLKDYDHIVAVLKRVNRDAYFNSVEGCDLDQRSIVALNERLIVAHDGIKDATEPQKMPART